MKEAIPEIELDKCNGCGDCVEYCPTNAVILVDNKAVIARPEDCDYCTDCEVTCPTGAVKCTFEVTLEIKSNP